MLFGQKTSEEEIVLKLERAWADRIEKGSW
jgi:hypothetical protein